MTTLIQTLKQSKRSSMLKATSAGILAIAMAVPVAHAGLLGSLLGQSTTASSSTNWGDPESKGIRPGNNITTSGASCTTSFIFTDNQGRYFVSTAAHCIVPGESTSVDGCSATYTDLSATVSQMDIYDPSNSIPESSVDLPAYYSSWHAMQDFNESSSAACNGNDFALLEVPAEHLDLLHPASLHFRAPTGIPSTAEDLQPAGAMIWGYGASTLKLGVSPLHPKAGFVLQTANEGWSYTVYLATPGIPGDSGGHIITDDGRALGVASTLALAPFALSNNYTNISKAIEYAERYLGHDLDIVTWDDFNASLLP